MAAIEGEDVLKIILDAIPSGVLVFKKDGRVAHVNEAAERIMATSKSRLVGCSFSDLPWEAPASPGVRITPDVHPFSIVTATMNPLYDFEFVVVRPDETRIVLSLDALPLNQDEGGLTGVVTFFDEHGKRKRAVGSREEDSAAYDGEVFSGRKKSEKALSDLLQQNSRLIEQLKSSEERFRSLVESATDGIISADGDGKIVFWNKAARDIFGYTADEMIGQELSILLPDRFKAAHREAINRLATTGESKLIGQVVELHGVKRDGSEFPLELSLSKWTAEEGDYFTGIVRDISGRKEMEEALAIERERLLVTLRSIGDGMIATDDQGTVVLINKVGEELTGWTEEEAIGRPLAEVFNIVNEETGEPAADPVAKALNSGIIVGLANHTALISKDGTERSIADSCAPIRTKGGGIIGAVLVFRDVTEERRTEELRNALTGINSVINSTLDFEDIIQKVVVEAGRAMGSGSAGIVLREDDLWVLRSLHGEGLPPDLRGRSFKPEEVPPIMLAAEIKDVVVSGDSVKDERFDRALMKAFGVRSFLIVPLVIKGEVFGAIFFTHHSRPVDFTNAQIIFARRLGTSLSLALNNARLYQTEHAISQTLQRALLDLPLRIAGVDYAHLYNSATTTALVGGDFYDVFELRDGRVAVAVGDVSGKGVEAAKLTSIVKTTLKAYAHEDRSPASTITRVNNMISKIYAPSAFASIFLGIIDLTEGVLTYCSAGHPPGIIKRGSGEIAFLPPDSPIIGFNHGMPYYDRAVALGESDHLVLYTDGIVEARCGDDFFGEDRLVECVEKAKSVHDTPKRVFEHVMEFTDGKLSDDLALLVVAAEKTSSDQRYGARESERAEITPNTGRSGIGSYQNLTDDSKTIN